MAGFDNEVVFGKNADFTSVDNQNVLESNGLVVDGKMWIGSTATNGGGTHVNVGTITSPGGTVTIGYSSPNITLDLNSSSNLLITTYNTADSPATWTKNSRTKVVEVYVWAGGGGGGGGRKGASTASGGGGGGGAGGSAYFRGPASFFNSSETVLIGSGGAGGAAQTATADGNVGIVGTLSSFGNIKAVPGNPGAGGSTGSVAGGTSIGTGSFLGFISLTNSTSQGRITAGVNGTSVGQVNGPGQINASGGGGGGGADAVTQRTGGIGGNNLDGAGVTDLAGGTAGLESTGIAGGDGNVPLSTGGVMTGGTGGGGGGGYSVGAGGATTGGKGGNGAIPGGGGGGGGGGLTAIADSGAGGNGANGRVIVIEYF